MKNGNRFVSPSSLHRCRCQCCCCRRCTTLQINGRHVNHFGHSKLKFPMLWWADYTPQVVQLRKSSSSSLWNEILLTEIKFFFLRVFNNRIRRIPVPLGCAFFTFLWLNFEKWTHTHTKSNSINSIKQNRLVKEEWALSFLILFCWFVEKKKQKKYILEKITIINVFMRTIENIFGRLCVCVPVTSRHTSIQNSKIKKKRRNIPKNNEKKHTAPKRCAVPLCWFQ